MENVEKKLENFDTKFDMILKHIASPTEQPPPTAVTTNRIICNMPTHDLLGCLHKDAYPELVDEHVNMMNDYQRPQNDPYLNFYNLG